MWFRNQDPDFNEGGFPAFHNQNKARMVDETKKF